MNSIACKNESDVATLASQINGKEKLNEENIVKVQTKEDLKLKDLYHLTSQKMN